MLHFNAMYLKALYFVKNGLVQLDKEASSSKRAYYLVGKHEFSVSIDEHGKFNCEQCSGRWNGNLCSHVIAVLLYIGKCNKGG